jgi:hypothetical protein
MKKAGLPPISKHGEANIIYAGQFIRASIAVIILGYHQSNNFQSKMLHLISPSCQMFASAFNHQILSTPFMSLLLTILLYCCKLKSTKSLLKKRAIQTQGRSLNKLA